MLNTQFTVEMGDGNARAVQVGLHPDLNAQAYCCTHCDQGPILTISHEGITFTVSPQDRDYIGEPDMQFAHSLSQATDNYLNEILRLHRDPPPEHVNRAS